MIKMKKVRYKDKIITNMIKRPFYNNKLIRWKKKNKSSIQKFNQDNRQLYFLFC